MTPCVLAIGGLDPGGGAGILADARAIAHAGAFACAVTTILTVQSTAGLVSVEEIPPATVLAACREVLAVQNVRVIKTGALGNEANVRAVASLGDLPLVVDPVMLPSRGGGRLLDEGAIDALRNHLFPKTTLLTANAPEAATLTGRPIESLADARSAARALRALGPRAVLVKGGHLTGAEAIDILVIGDELIELLAPRIEDLSTHGGGCVLASLIAGRLATGDELEAAVRSAKQIHREALANAREVGGPARVLL